MFPSFVDPSWYDHSKESLDDMTRDVDCRDDGKAALKETDDHPFTAPRLVSKAMAWARQSQRRGHHRRQRFSNTAYLVCVNEKLNYCK